MHPNSSDRCKVFTMLMCGRKIGASRPRYIQIVLLLIWALALNCPAFGQTADPVTAPSAPAELPADPLAAEPATETTSDPAAVPSLETTPEPPLYSSRSDRDSKLLASAAPEDVRWLDADEQILGLFRPTEIRVTKGAVLLLHAAETPPGWPVVFENARRTLPQFGWATLAVTLPAKTTTSPPKRELVMPPVDEQLDTDTAIPPAEPSSTTAEAPVVSEPEPQPQPEPEREQEPGETPDNPTGVETSPLTVEAPPPTRAEIISARVDAALAWLAAEGHTSVILVIDNSSVVDTLAHLQGTTSSSIAALILMNLQTFEALTTAELEAVFTAGSPPVLDVFISPEQGKMTALRKRHRAVALRQKVTVYHQQHLQEQVPATLDDHQSFWVGRLRGFIEQQESSKTRP
jgi:hypothetical protein